MDERERHAPVRVMLPNMEHRLVEDVQWFRVYADGILELGMSDEDTIEFEVDGWVDVRFVSRD